MSTLEIPTRLPVDYLSVSSVNTFIKCPERWKRRYVDREYEPPSGAMILGSAVGAAEGDAYQIQIDEGERPPEGFTLDTFDAEFEERSEREEIDWGSDTRGAVKDIGVKAIEAYDKTIAPNVVPASVEREFNLHFEGVEWGFKGFIDLEEEDGAVDDMKVRKSRLGQRDANADIQPTGYLLAKRAEGNPAPEFRFHTMVKTKTPYAEVVPTERTDRQLDQFIDRLYTIAAEIQWRCENDVWGLAVPGSWWCGRKMCGFYDSCPGGGLR